MKLLCLDAKDMKILFGETNSDFLVTVLLYPLDHTLSWFINCDNIPDFKT